MENHNQKHYYSGGLAEFVTEPTILTYSFFSNWFTGNKSLGMAMKLLDLPFNETQTAILEMMDKDCFVNLKEEESTLYQNTVFRFAPQDNPHTQPRLELSLSKAVIPNNIFNTLRILLAQSAWIGFQDNTLKKAQNFVDEIPAIRNDMSLPQIDKMIAENVFPNVLAVGMLAEFYALTLNNSKSHTKINSYIRDKDWFYKSIFDQTLVRSGKMNFEDFIRKYGTRADKDYELSAPRWHETPSHLKANIAKLNNFSIPVSDEEFKLNKMEMGVASLQILRSESKRKALVWVDVLRKELKKISKNDKTLSLLTRNKILNTSDGDPIIHKQTAKINQNFKSGKGQGASTGTVSGKVVYITESQSLVPKNSIAVFPNASPQFSTQFPQAQGLVFLRGGMTSHGLIVAREFGIPAIIDHNFPDNLSGKAIFINGGTGDWHS